MGFRRRLMMAQRQGGGGDLPAGYTSLVYLENWNAAYIDTGYVMSENSRTEVTMAMADEKRLMQMGAINYGSNYFRWHLGYQNCIIIMRNKEGSEEYNQNIPYDSSFHDFVIAYDYTSIDGVPYTVASDWRYIPASPFGIFGRLGNTSSTIYSNALNSVLRGKISSLKQYESDVLVRDYVPAMRNSDGECGMYEMVTGTFMTSVNNLPFRSNILPTGYTKIDHITSNGSAYINTGLKIVPATARAIMTFRTSTFGTTGWFYGLLGARTSAGSTDGSYALLQNNQNSIRCDWTTRPNTNTYTNANTNYIYCLDIQCQYVTLDGTNTKTKPEGYTGGTSTSISSYNFFFGNFNNAGSAWSGSKYSGLEGDIFGAVLYDNGTMLFNGVPCTNPNGVYGLYDLISDSFFPSASSTPFTGA